MPLSETSRAEALRRRLWGASSRRWGGAPGRRLEGASGRGFWSTASAVPIRIALAALGFRLLSSFLALCVNLAFPLDRREQLTVFGTTSKFWDTFARFDTGYYEGIAWNGYQPLAGARSNIAYFPVYPMLMRFFGRLFGRHHAIYFMAGIGVSWGCFILAMVALYYLARLDLLSRGFRR